MITRLCVNHLQSARVQRESYIGSWLPELLVEQRSPKPDEAGAPGDSLSFASMPPVETLTPTERAVFILRNRFDCEFAETAGIVREQYLIGPPSGERRRVTLSAACTGTMVVPEVFARYLVAISLSRSPHFRRARSPSLR